MRSEIDLAILAVSGVLFGVLSGAHTALEALSYRPSDREEDEKEEHGRFIARLTGNPVYHYVSLGVGRIAVLAVLVVSASHFAGAQASRGGLLAPAVWILAVLSAVVPLVAAKALSLRDPTAYLRRARYATSPIVYLAWPVAYVLVAAFRRVCPRALDGVVFPIIPFKKRLELVGASDRGGESEERQLVSSVLDFGDTKVREVMVPRIDMVALNVHTPASEAVSVVVEAGHSRIPVYDDSIDKIVGILHAKDVLAKVVAGEEFAVEDIVREAYFVPESKKIGDLLGEFRRRKIHIAIAVDEYGGTAGLVTLEDVLEELVGDIQDEFDVEEALVRVLDPDTALCSAKLRLDELHETFGVDLREGDADTLGGFLYETVGRVPRVGESFSSRGLEFRIESVVGQRIDKVLVKGLSAVSRKAESPKP